MKSLPYPPFLAPFSTALLFLGLVSPVFGQTTYTFSTAGNWTTPANWSGGVVPPDPLPTGDFIIIDANCTLEEAKTINGALTVNATRTWTIYHASNSFSFSNNGTVNNNGTVSIREQFSNNAGATFTNFSGASFLFGSSGGILVNFGSFTNNSGGTVSMPSFGSISNENGGVFTNNGSFSYNSVWTNKTGSTLNNNSTFNITGASAAFQNQAGSTMNLGTGSTFNTQCFLTNNGTINLVAGGKLKLLQDPAVLPGGTFNWAGTVAINANMYVYSGQTFTVPAGATFELDNSLSYLLVYSGGTLVNNGTMTLKGRLDNSGTTTGTGAFNLNTTNGEIYNSSGGSFTCNGTMTINSAGSNAGFRNFSGGTLTNNGTINTNGFFTNSGTFSNVGTFNLNSGGTLEMNTSPATIPGGTLNWNAGMLRIGTNGVMTLANTLTVPSGCTFSASSTAAFTISSSGQLVNNGYVYIYSPTVNDGTITNPGQLSVWSGSAGTLTNNGTLSNSSTMNLQKTFTNNGTFNFTAGNVYFCYTNAAFPVGTLNWTGGTMNIGDGSTCNGTMTLASPVAIPANTVLKATNSGLLTNSSTMTINSGGKLETKYDNFLNNSVIVNNGIFKISSGSTFYTDGTLKGSGAFQSALYWNQNYSGGTVAPGASPGCLSFANGYHNGTGTLSLEINGPTACTEFDQVQVTGSMIRGGTLALNFGFTPTVGQTFQIITASSFSGSFSSTTVSPANISVSLSNGLLTVTAVLPVELTGFSAKPMGKAVRLDWQTASESNNRGFQIERSLDGENWQPLGFVAGEGTTAEPSGYFFVDEKPAAGLNYYRLAQLDFDGKTTFSEVVSAKMDGAADWLWFQNPVSGELVMHIGQTAEEPCQIWVRDAQGRLVFEKTAAGPSEKLDLSDLPNGAYWLQAASGDRSAVRPFLKM